MKMNQDTLSALQENESPIGFKIQEWTNRIDLEVKIYKTEDT